MSESVAVQVLLGLYLGILTGIFPALIAFALGFVFKYFTNVTVPGLGVVVLAGTLAGVQGGLMGLLDPAITETWIGITALLVVLMISLWAHARGDALGAEFPHRITLETIRKRTLSDDVIERVGTFGQVRLRVIGQVGDIEGYPPISDHVRRAIQEGSWTFPADLPIEELETRLADRLRNDHDLAEVSVTINEKGRAEVSAAPEPGGLSRRVPAGRRAASVRTVLPTGMARGDEVTLELPDRTIDGTLVSARSDGASTDEPNANARAEEPAATAGAGGSGGSGGTSGTAGTATTTGAATRSTTGEDAIDPSPPPRTPTTTGGDGRITVAVTPTEATHLLATESARTIVKARGKRREYELVSLIKGAGKQFRTMTVRKGGPLDGTTLGEAAVRDVFGVDVLAIRRPNQRIVGPRGSTTVEGDDEMIVVGRREPLENFRREIA